MLLKLLLFVDDRLNCWENIQQIRDYLHSEAHYPFNLQVIETREQPHLVEHFKLVATPALVKIYPSPRQTLAGSNLITQLRKCWLQWQASAGDAEAATSPGSLDEAIACSAEVMRLSDEIFCLRQEQDKLREQLRFKDQIVAMLAHDLRSPLTAASIAVDTLELAQSRQDEADLVPLKQHLHQQIRQQFRAMNRMIADLLQASKSTGARLNLDPSQLSIQTLCQEIAAQFASRFQDKRQQFDQDIPQDLPTVYADQELLRQVLINLLENAVKYTPEAGIIKLSALHRTTQKIQISISDTGPGIPIAEQERIFEGHFRLQRDEAQDGYGLGLALCRQIINAHYGQIWVDSALNQGSCFHFTLPVYRCET
ncbi:MAG: histidine kinase [Cyanophyceae cyanobacterium]